jgi:hypothetical protein
MANEKSRMDFVERTESTTIELETFTLEYSVIVKVQLSSALLHKFPQLVTDHATLDIYWYKFLPVGHCNSMAHHRRRYCRRPRPGLHGIWSVADDELEKQ